MALVDVESTHMRCQHGSNSIHTSRQLDCKHVGFNYLQWHAAFFCVETCLEWHARIPSLIHPHSLRIHARRGRMHSYSVRTCWAAMLRPTARSLSSSRTCLGSKSRSLAKQILVLGVFQRPTPWWRRTLLKFTNRRWEDTWKYYIFCAGRNPGASLRWPAMCRIQRSLATKQLLVMVLGKRW